MLKLANAYGMKFLVPPNDEGVGSCLLEAGEFARVELKSSWRLATEICG
ncbi:hypothetical protein [Phenylobacterium sp.]|jgi:hypothetical protein